MLIYFSCENFRSIKEPIELDLRAAPRLRRLKHHVRTPTEDKALKVLKSAVMYGANASGKSNVVKALKFVKDLVTGFNQPQREIATEPFALTESKIDKSSFYIEFTTSNHLHFVYGIELSQSGIVKEQLLLIEDGKEKKLFQRLLNDKGEFQFFSDFYHEASNEKLEFEILGKYTAANKLFLSEGKEKDAFFNLHSIGGYALSAYSFFSHELAIVQPEQNLTGFYTQLKNMGDMSQILDSLMNQFDTGIGSIKTEREELSFFPEYLITTITVATEKLDAFYFPYNGKDYIAIKTRDHQLQISSLQTIHTLSSNQEVSFPLKDESDGSRRLLELLPLLSMSIDKRNMFNMVVLIDELDRSLHPLLSRKYLDLFLNAENDNQLLVTTHEAELLDNDLLRRDEIWFVQKEWDHSTKLYSLNDYSTRFDKDIHKAYLEGKFGAVPIIMDEFRKS